MKPGTLLTVAMTIFGAACSLSVGPDRATATPTLTATSWPTVTVQASATAPVLPASTTPEPTPDLSWITDAPLAEQADYEIPPNLQYLSADTAWIHFSVPQGDGLMLHIWPEPDPGSRREIAHEPDQNGVVIEGLSPDTTYLVQVLIEEDGLPRAPRFLGDAWGLLRFHTLPDDPVTLRIGVIGDSGFGDRTTLALVEQLAARNLDFVVHTGDVVYRGEENENPADAYARKFYQAFAPLLRSIPIYPVLGNHEYDLPVRLDGRPYYFQAFPAFPESLEVPGEGDSERNWYAIEAGGWQFIFLNTQTFFGIPGRQEQLDWLEAHLAAMPESRSILLMHVPPYSHSRHLQDSALVASNLSSFFQRYPIAMTLGGHDHNYQRFLLEGVHHVVSGGGSATLYGVSGSGSGLQFAAAESHVLILDLGPNQVEILALDENGIALERGLLELD